MIVAAHAPAYLPSLGYLDNMAKVDMFVVMDDAPFEPGSCANRQRVRLCDGPTSLVVPVEPGEGTARVCDQRIDNTGSPTPHWQQHAWRTSEVNYGRARHFERYADELRAVYTQPWISLVELDLHLLGLARAWLGIKTPVVRSSELGLTRTNTDLLIELCTRLGARAYLTESGDSVDAEKLGRAGIGVIWQSFEHPVYPQRYPQRGFDSHLAFIDLVLNCGPASRDILFDHAHPARVVAA